MRFAITSFQPPSLSVLPHPPPPRTNTISLQTLSLPPLRACMCVKPDYEVKPHILAGRERTPWPRLGLSGGWVPGVSEVWHSS